MASVEQHRGRWRARITISKRRQWVTLPDDVRTRAQAIAAAERIATLNRVGALRKRERDVTAPEGEPWAAWFDRWMEIRKNRGYTSVPADKSRVKKWVKPIIGALASAAVSREHLEQLVRHLDRAVEDDEIEWKTACNAWGVVTAAFGEMQRSKEPALRVRADNPAKEVRGPDRGDEKARGYLHPAELLRLVACAAVPVRWARLYILPVYLGLRAGEVAALEVRDIDFDARLVTVARSIAEASGESKAPKSGVRRQVPINPSVRPLLEALVREAKEAKRERLVVMPHRNGDKGLAAHLREHLRRAGVVRQDLHETTPTSRRVGYHDLRATCVTWWCLAGVESLIVQLWAGHADLSTTSGYVRAAASLHGVGGGAPHPPLPARLFEVSPALSPTLGATPSKGFVRRRSGVASPEGFEPSFDVATGSEMPGNAASGTLDATVGDRSRQAGDTLGDSRVAIRAAVKAALEAGDDRLAYELLGRLQVPDRPGLASAGGGVIPITRARQRTVR